MPESHVPDYLLAFDASSTAIGYAYFAMERLVACGSVLSAQKTPDVRIVDLMVKLREVFPRIASDVVCVMEWSEGRPMLFLKKTGRSAQSSVPLAHAQGAVFFWLISQGLTVECVGESEWTRQRGKYLPKEVRASHIHLMYPEFGSVWIADARGDKHDAADAVGLGLYWIGRMKILDVQDQHGGLTTRIPGED